MAWKTKSGSTAGSDPSFLEPRVSELETKLNNMARVLNENTWIATQGQTDFSLTNGIIGSEKLLDVYIGGVLQDDIVLVNSSTFRVSEPLPVGMRVTAEWFESEVPMGNAHKATHEKGGADELDITKLKGYDAIATQLTTNPDSFLSSTEQCQTIRNVNKQSNTFRFSTFNILQMRSFKNYYIQKAKETINKSGSNLCATQESFNGALFNYTSKMKSDLFPNTSFGQAVFNYTQGCNYGVGLLSDTVITQSSMTLYDMLGTTYEQRGFLRVLLNVNGMDLAVYITHLSFEDAKLPPSQLNELFTAMQADSVTHKILLGDFNTESLGVFFAFTNAGYSVQNNGTYKTFKPTSLAIDNIIVSNNISVVNKGMIISGDESDHNLFYVDFKLI